MNRRAVDLDGFLVQVDREAANDDLRTGVSFRAARAGERDAGEAKGPESTRVQRLRGRSARSAAIPVAYLLTRCGR